MFKKLKKFLHRNEINIYMKDFHDFQQIIFSKEMMDLYREKNLEVNIIFDFMLKEN